MFPERVGRMVLDGMEFVKDGRTPWGWATSSSDNVTIAFEDGFIGECIQAGPEQCALATETVINTSHYDSLHSELLDRLDKLFRGLVAKPIPGYTSHGPGLITYEYLTSWLYTILYHPAIWKESAKILADLEKGNATLALEATEQIAWSYKPGMDRDPSSGELLSMVVCVSAFLTSSR
jgi:hypothetical protein